MSEHTSIRYDIDAHLWNEARGKGVKENKTGSEVIEEALKLWLAGGKNAK